MLLEHRLAELERLMVKQGILEQSTHSNTPDTNDDFLERLMDVLEDPTSSTETKAQVRDEIRKLCVEKESGVCCFRCGDEDYRGHC